MQKNPSHSWRSRNLLLRPFTIACLQRLIMDWLSSIASATSVFVRSSVNNASINRRCSKNECHRFSVIFNLDSKSCEHRLRSRFSLREEGEVAVLESPNGLDATAESQLRGEVSSLNSCLSRPCLYPFGQRRSSQPSSNRAVRDRLLRQARSPTAPSASPPREPSSGACSSVEPWSGACSARDGCSAFIGSPGSTYA